MRGVGGVTASGPRRRVEFGDVAVESGGVAGQQGDRVTGVGESARQGLAETRSDTDEHGGSYCHGACPSGSGVGNGGEGVAVGGPDE